jgi:L-2-hydroxyglutarate oxidase LhgO
MSTKALVETVRQSGDGFVRSLNSGRVVKAKYVVVAAGGTAFSLRAGAAQVASLGVRFARYDHHDPPTRSMATMLYW